MNFQSAAFYKKWLQDFKDAQRPDGGVPVLVPNGGWGNGESWTGAICPAWDVAYPLIVWDVYRYTGDRRVLEQHAESLRRYVDFFLTHLGANGLAPGLGIGDWSAWKTETPLDFITNAYLYLDLTLLSQIFMELGNETAEARFRALGLGLKSAIQLAFYNPATHQYSNGSQTAQSMALYFGLVSPLEKFNVFAELVRSVEHLGHLDVGILGAKHLLRTLSEGGRTDLAFHIATQTEMPGWGYWAKAGATTLWEQWDAGPSYNHIMFGDISAWFYTWIAGIQQEIDSVGFERIVFCPNPVGQLTSARAYHLAPRGKVAIEWALQGRKMHLSLEVPCGSSARLVLPAGARLVSAVDRIHCQARQPLASAPMTSLTSGRHELDVLLT